MLLSILSIYIYVYIYIPYSKCSSSGQSLWQMKRVLKGLSSLSTGTKEGPQSTRILIMGTLKKVPPIFGRAPVHQHVLGPFRWKEEVVQGLSDRHTGVPVESQPKLSKNMGSRQRPSLGGVKQCFYQAF